MDLIINEGYLVGGDINKIEKECILLIEKELNSFFEIRLKSVYLISEFYIKDSIRNLTDILNFISISDDELENLIETVKCKISNKISYNLSNDTIYFNFESSTRNYKQYIENSIDIFTRTECILGFFEKFLDKSLSKILKIYCQNIVLNYVVDKTNLPDKILGSYGVKKQKQKHVDIITKQLNGFILNLKCELRNNLVSSTLVLINTIYTYNETQTVA